MVNDMIGSRERGPLHEAPNRSWPGRVWLHPVYRAVQEPWPHSYGRWVSCAPARRPCEHALRTTPSLRLLPAAAQCSCRPTHAHSPVPARNASSLSCQALRASVALRAWHRAPSNSHHPTPPSTARSLPPYGPPTLPLAPPLVCRSRRRAR